MGKLTSDLCSTSFWPTLWPRLHTPLRLRRGELEVTLDTVVKPNGISPCLLARLLPERQFSTIPTSQHQGEFGLLHTEVLPSRVWFNSRFEPNIAPSYAHMYPPSRGSLTPHPPLPFFPFTQYTLRSAVGGVPGTGGCVGSFMQKRKRNSEQRWRGLPSSSSQTLRAGNEGLWKRGDLVTQCCQSLGREGRRTQHFFMI